MPTAPQDLVIVFGRLRKILAAYAQRLVVVEDSPLQYYLDTGHVMPNGRPLFFASVRMCRGYVSFHLMPLYVFPDLLRRVPARLKSRMHGKSCFNFRKVDAAEIKDLASLASLGLDRYQKEGKL